MNLDDKKFIESKTEDKDMKSLSFHCFQVLESYLNKKSDEPIPFPENFKDVKNNSLNLK